MFENRETAGAALAKALEEYAADNLVIYALPRGGLPVAAEVAKRLGAPLDVIFVRKIGAPMQPELAIGAIVDGAAPCVVLHQDIISELGVSDKYVSEAKTVALKEIERRRLLYSRDRESISATGQTAIVCDDGLATGSTMEAALKAIRKTEPERVIVAVPIAPADTVARLRSVADEVVCLETPSPFWSVGGHYRAFPQLTDEDVIRILDTAGQRDTSEAEASMEKHRSVQRP